MGALKGVATEARDLAEVEPEPVLEPVDGLGGPAGEDLDQVVPGEVAGRLFRVGKEDLGAVADAELLLGVGASTVDLADACDGQLSGRETLVTADVRRS